VGGKVPEDSDTVAVESVFASSCNGSSSSSCGSVVYPDNFKCLPVLVVVTTAVVAEQGRS